MNADRKIEQQWSAQDVVRFAMDLVTDHIVQNGGEVLEEELKEALAKSNYNGPVLVDRLVQTGRLERETRTQKTEKKGENEEKINYIRLPEELPQEEA